jgi:hypothetical protein
MDVFRGSRVGVIVQCEQGHVVIPSYSEATAFSSDGERLMSWRGGGDHYANFLQAVRSRQHTDLNADILDGHLSSALCHTGNISHRMGVKDTARGVAESIGDQPLLRDSFQRMADHLTANGVNLDEPVLTRGAELVMDPAAETFPGNDVANLHTTRAYRNPYVVPEIAPPSAA